MENDKVKQELRSIIEDVYRQIVHGQIERGWEAVEWSFSFGGYLLNKKYSFILKNIQK